MFLSVNRTLLLLACLCPSLTYAAIALQQSRIVFDGEQSSSSLFVVNQNTDEPYLAQGWIEDENSRRIKGPLLVLPPIQRIEPGQRSQIVIQALPAARLLRQDRETLFYLNLREIPPKIKQGNTLQIALQNHIKIFYRPVALKNHDLASPWLSRLVLTRQDNRWQINNPSPYYITLVDAQTSKNGQRVTDFQPFMLEPGESVMLPGDASHYGQSPVFTYLNDYGGRPEITFTCSPERCSVISNQVPKG